MNEFLVSTSPHTRGKFSISAIMKDVVIALVPSVIACLLVFGVLPIVNILLCIGSCILAEFLFCKIVKTKVSIGDWSSVVTGLILGLNLPPIVPFYVPIVGGFFAIMIVKMLFGGLGKNFANPAMATRVFLMLAWTSLMTKFSEPISLSNGFSELFKSFPAFWGGNIDLITSATPLMTIKDGGSASLLNMFLGNVGGTAGETSALALIIGGAYLVVRKIIDWKIPVIIVASTAMFTIIFGQGFSMIMPNILGGGLLLGAIFMATDYSTSPNTSIGIIIYSVVIAFFTILLRIYSSMPEGFSYALLMANILAPLLDKYIVPKPFGYVKAKKVKGGKVL